MKKTNATKETAAETLTAPAFTGLDSYLAWTVKNYTRLGGSLVEEEHFEERKKICEACDKYGEVTIEVPLIGKFKEFKTAGCTVCGCPTATKPRTKTYFSFYNLEIIETTCPHPDGNKWEEVDHKFFNNKNK